MMRASAISFLNRMLPTPWRRTDVSTLKAISGNNSGVIRRMQFGCTAHHAALDIGDDDRAIVSAFCGIVFDETVIHEAMETVVTAFRIESQEMVAQQRQFLLLTQRPNGALCERRTRNVLVVHLQNSSWKALEEASNP